MENLSIIGVKEINKNELFSINGGILSGPVGWGLTMEWVEGLVTGTAGFLVGFVSGFMDSTKFKTE